MHWHTCTKQALLNTCWSVQELHLHYKSILNGAWLHSLQQLLHQPGWELQTALQGLAVGQLPELRLCQKHFSLTFPSLSQEVRLGQKGARSRKVSNWDPTQQSNLGYKQVGTSICLPNEKLGISASIWEIEKESWGSSLYFYLPKVFNFII